MLCLRERHLRLKIFGNPFSKLCQHRNCPRFSQFDTDTCTIMASYGRNGSIMLYSSTKTGIGHYSRIATTPARGVYLPGGCACWGVCLPRGVYLPGGVPATGGVPAWGCACLGGACWGGVPAGGGLPQTCPPPVNRMTNRCKNITLATTASIAAVPATRCHYRGTGGVCSSPHLMQTP